MQPSAVCIIKPISHIPELIDWIITEFNYPRRLNDLAIAIGCPEFPKALKKFIYQQRHPKREVPPDYEQRVTFDGKINVFHSAVVTFFSPSDECGRHGMRREYIRSHPSWYGHFQPRRDTVFVVTDEDCLGMEGMLVAWVLLFFDYHDDFSDITVPCALVNWFLPRGRDGVTGLWVVEPEKIAGQKPVQVIHLETIARGSHLLPKFGDGFLGEEFSFVDALDAFRTFYVNQHIDYHAHRLLRT